MSKSRWEVKFERYMSEEPVSEKIESLSRKIEEMKNGKIKGEFKTKEEYETAKSKRDGDIGKLENELKGYKNYEKNKDKIKNIYEYRKNLQGKLEKLPKDRSKQIQGEYEYLDEAKKQLTTTGEECDRLSSEIDELNAKLKNAKDGEKETIKEEIAKKREALGVAQDKQTELMKKIPAAQELLDKLKAEDKEFDKYRNKRETYERKIAKCNIIAANLLKGRDIDDIDLSVESRDSRFTAKGEEAVKAKGLREAAKRLIINPATLEVEGVKKALSKVNEFAKKHPRLAKIGAFFKNIKDKFANAFKGKQEENTFEDKDKVEKTEKEAEEEAIKTEEELEKEENAFIKSIAVKGHDAATRDKYEAGHEKAVKENAETYGGIYNDIAEEELEI